MRCTSNGSPSRAAISRSTFSASGEPTKITSFAFTPTMACVHAQPRSLSAIICTSSMIATSYSASVASISMVEETCRAFGSGKRSSPVMSEQGTPAARMRSQNSAAMSRSGARYTPVFAAASIWKAA